ncbi:uncharacterized protein LOC116776305 isoform X1 [Danaus plexippus]|uniref:uncharacterized protein LOC116776305 isoform X1 n=1 Tax=Danaus plexippus TaxID=13037 RepID=UPI002AB0B27B|nr:uncharacterized protein LOC116776305 isoform X1 [Danaus plexippus]
MKILIICFLSLAVTVTYALTYALKKPYYDLKDAPALFEKFVRDYNRHYKDEADIQVHYEAFVQSLKEINKANAESPSAVFDINLFADYTKEETSGHHGMLNGNRDVTK